MQGMRELQLQIGAQEGLMEMVACEQRLEGRETGSYEDTRRKRLPGTGNSQCKSYEACPCCVRGAAERPEWSKQSKWGRQNKARGPEEEGLEGQDQDLRVFSV